MRKLTLFVVTVDEGRWVAAQAEADDDIELVKVEGVLLGEVSDSEIAPLIEYRTPEGYERVEYRKKKVAIRRSMRHAVQVVAAAGGGTIVQDDYTTRPGHGPFVIHSEPVSPSHVCPRAFTVDSDTAAVLADVWAGDLLSACGLWQPLVRKSAIRDITARRVG